MVIKDAHQRAFLKRSAAIVAETVDQPHITQSQIKRGWQGIGDQVAFHVNHIISFGCFEIPRSNATGRPKTIADAIGIKQITARDLMIIGGDVMRFDIEADQALSLAHVADPEFDPQVKLARLLSVLEKDVTKTAAVS